MGYISLSSDFATGLKIERAGVVYWQRNPEIAIAVDRRK